MDFYHRHFVLTDLTSGYVFITYSVVRCNIAHAQFKVSTINNNLLVNATECSIHHNNGIATQLHHYTRAPHSCAVY